MANSINKNGIEMKTYESVFKYKYPLLVNGEVNYYDFHNYSQEKVIECCNMHEDYCYSIRPYDNDYFIYIRTPTRTDHVSERPVSYNYKNGDVVKFIVDLHMSRYVEDIYGKRKKKAIPDDTHRVERVQRIGEKCGFDLVEHKVLKTFMRYYKKHSGQHFYLAGTTMELIVTITDFEFFHDGIVFGIGSKRTFGFGMIMMLEKMND